MLIGSKQRISQYSGLEKLGLKINGVELANKTNYTYLGLIIDSNLTWNEAVMHTCKKLGSRVALSQRLMKVIPRIYINTIYYAFIQPYIDYAISVWGYTSMGNIDKIQRLQNRVARIFMNDFSYEHHSIDIIHKLGWQTVLERREFLTGILMFKCIFNLAPFYLSDNITYVSQIHDHQTRNCANDNLYVPQPRTEYIKRSFLYNGSKIWNKLPLDVRRSQNICQFKVLFKRWQKSICSWCMYCILFCAVLVNILVF